MNTPAVKTAQTLTVDEVLLAMLGDELLLAALPLPPRAPTLADVASYEAEAIKVCHTQARVIARTQATVAPRRAS